MPELSISRCSHTTKTIKARIEEGMAWKSASPPRHSRRSESSPVAINVAAERGYFLLPGCSGEGVCLRRTKDFPLAIARHLCHTWANIHLSDLSGHSAHFFFVYIRLFMYREMVRQSVADTVE